MNNTVISKKAKNELRLIRLELKKDKPDSDLLFNLISGNKYNVPIK